MKDAMGAGINGREEEQRGVKQLTPFTSQGNAQRCFGKNEGCSMWRNKQEGRDVLQHRARNRRQVSRMTRTLDNP